MASVRKRGPKWEVRWRDPDGCERSRSCPSAAAAKALRRDVEDSVAQGRRWEPRDARARARLRDVAGEYLTTCARRLRTRTLVRYGQMLEAFVGWAERDRGRAGVHLDELSQSLVERFFDALLHEPFGRHGGVRSVETAKKHVEVVQLFWRWAEGRDAYADQVPRFRGMEMPPTQPRDPPTAPTWGEMDRAIGAARGWYRSLLLLMRCTGLRVGQAMRLRWRDVDLEREVLTIRGELGKSDLEARGRRVPLAPALVAELRAPGLVEWGDDWLVPVDRAPREARSRDIVRIWRRAGVREAAWKGAPDHAFRRGFISGLRGLGANGDAVEYLVGHVLPGMLAPYVDAEIGLPLKDAVGRVPPIVASAPAVAPRLTPTRTRLIDELRARGPRGVGELAAILVVDPSTLRHLVRRAVDAGVLVRDRRLIRLPESP